MSSPNVQGVPPYRQHQELEQVVASGDHTILSSVIISQSRSRARNDVLADALAISCEKGHHKAAHYLLATENAKPDLPSRNLGRCKGLPPLVLAVKHYHSSSRSGLKAKLPEQTVAPQTMDGLDTIKSLLEHGCALSDHGPDGRNALSHVATIELAELLLAQQSDTERRKALVDVRDKKFENDALMWAIVNKECSDAVVMEYIRQGANRHTVDKAGRTTLMNAAWTGRIPVVELLLQDESIAKKTDNRGRNIWHHIASDTDRSQSDGITDLIFAMDDRDVKVDAKDKQGQTALNLSAMFSTKAVGRQLLEEKSPAIDAIENHEERTALHFAAANGDAEFVAMLLAKGANRSAKCSSGLIPIHLLCACPGDPVDAATFLLSNNARKQLTSLTEEKMTPLHIAAAHGNPGIVNMILQTQDPIDIDALCEGDWTALHLACGRHMAPSQKPSAAYGRSAKQPIVPDRDSTFVNERYLDVVRALLSKGAGVNKKSRLSRTALHIAAEMGHIGIVKLLLEQEDVQFSAKDSRGNTPLLDAAKSNERDKILPLLSPWNERFIRSLPENVKQAAKDYDANVIDFQTAAGTKTQRHKIPIFNVLYRGFSQHGSMTHKNVSTRPDSSEEGAFRWIHLPANNLHWCHTLLTKHFIEGGFSADVESFKALERSLSLQQYRGRRIHSRFMRPACTKLGRRYGDHSHIKSDLSAHDHHIRTFTRVNSTEVTDAKSAPPSPRDHRFFADRDLDGLQPGSGIVDNVRAHDPTSAPIAQEKFITTAPLDEVLEADDASAAVQDCKPSTTAEQAIKASEGTCLFMPYLTLKNKLRVSIMHDELPTTSKFHTPSPHSSRRNASRSDNRDARLHHAYSEWDANDYCLHVRRTLDQFWYRNVDTRERDGDQVVQRYQQREQELQGFERESTDVDSLMVDQLWIWILGPSLIVTSFPQDWQQPRHKMPDLLSSILEEIDPRTGTPVQSVYELGACIVGHCLSSCDQSADQNSKPSVLEMFGSSVGEVMNREVMLFRRFKEASVKASQWVKCTLQENIVDGNRQLQDLEDDYFNKVAQNATLHSGRSGSSDDRDRTGTDEPKFVEDLLDIHDETKLLEEVKDIQDELGILLQVVEDQKDVNSKMEKAMKSLLRSEHEPHQLKVGTMLDEQRVLLDQQKSEIENMNQQVKSTYKSITDLLDHKQKHANAIEARYARKQAADTAKAGRTLMVFTIVTVIFLPLSFLSAFFAINLEELPYNGQGKISVGFILKYVLGVGFGTALAFVLLAWHHHRAVRWFKPKWHLCQGWLLRQKTTLLRPFKQRNKAEEETSTTGSSSSSSSSTLRSRGQNVNNDLEKGKKSST